MIFPFLTDASELHEDGGCVNETVRVHVGELHVVVFIDEGMPVCCILEAVTHPGLHWGSAMVVVPVQC
jgi:hypothetical protein